MRKFEKITTPTGGHRVYLCRGEEPLRAQVPRDVRHPVCLIAFERAVEPTTFCPALKRLLLSGASYFCCYGPNASAIHFQIDSLIVSMDVMEGVKLERGRRVIPTIGEDETPLTEVIEFMLNTAAPTTKKNFDYLVWVWGGTKFVSLVLKTIEQTSNNALLPSNK